MKVFGVTPGHVEARCHLKQVRLGVLRRRNHVAHVKDDDLGHSIPPSHRPASSGTEHPAHLPTGILERDSVAVEHLGEADVMQKRGYAEQLRVEVDAVSRGVGATPQVGPHTVIEQGGRGVLRAHFQRGGCGRRIRQTSADLGSHRYLRVDRPASAPSGP
jgi:hypothetical protein